MDPPVGFNVNPGFRVDQFSDSPRLYRLLPYRVNEGLIGSEERVMLNLSGINQVVSKALQKAIKR